MNLGVIPQALSTLFLRQGLSLALNAWIRLLLNKPHRFIHLSLSLLSCDGTTSGCYHT